MKGMDFGNKKVDLTKKPVGPIATQKPFDPESLLVDKSLDDALHRKHAERFYEQDNPNEKKKKYPKSYTKKDIKFLEDQREDVVREEDKN